ncbi:MAG: hypothetical protein IJQ50_03520, partial [Clostridia bacterium]|nr:hypothetical protein [Clostridia bacterium]
MNFVIGKRQLIKMLLLLLISLLLICFITGYSWTSISNVLNNKYVISQMISDCIPSFYSFNVMDLKKLSVRIIGFDI